MTVPDLLRLLAVPVFLWVAWHDVRTRRIPSRTWYPLVGLGAVLLVWDYLARPADPYAQRLFLLRVAVSIGLLGVLAVGFWYMGAMGGADAKAFVTIGVLYPVFPAFVLGGVHFPLVRPPLGVFSLAILTDAVLVGLVVPAALYVRNALAGRRALVAFVGYPVPVSSLLSTPGKLLETPAGFTRRGLDLDALRMYLRWRGLALADLRAHAETLRRPSTLPAEPNPPTDGVVDPTADPEPAESLPAATYGGDADDAWGAQAFLDDVGSAYGTAPATLRDALDLLVDRDRVWISPGLPFLVLVAAGLVCAYVFGNLLYVVLGLLGVA